MRLRDTIGDVGLQAAFHDGRLLLACRSSSGRGLFELPSIKVPLERDWLMAELRRDLLILRRVVEALRLDRQSAV